MPKKVTVEDVAEVRRLMETQGLSLRRACARVGRPVQTVQYHLEPPAKRMARLDGRRRNRKAFHLVGQPSTRPRQDAAPSAYEEIASGFDVLDLCRAFARGDFDRGELSRRLNGQIAGRA